MYISGKDITWRSDAVLQIFLMDINTESSRKQKLEEDKGSPESLGLT
jgi:hypothetical protein